MGVKIKDIGKVELWRDEYIDAKLKPGTADQLKSPKTQFNNMKERLEYEAKYTTPLNRLTNAIAIAPAMAKVAVDRLTSLLMERDASAFLPPSHAREKSLTNTVLALFKYFNIPHDLRSLDRNDPHWHNVTRILEIYERTLEGMSKAYKIYLYEDQTAGGSQKALGFVRHAKVEGEEPIRAYFRTAPDVDGHIAYPHWHPTSDIHIRMNALLDKQHHINEKNDGVVARLLLHEATHKWANTLDICYKWDTIAQKNKHQEWNVAEAQRKDKGRELARHIKSGAQPSLALPGRDKPLLSMAKVGVASTDWVYNADSYACAARRLWKEETNGGSLAYANWEE
jgi:hypothetical protein